MRFKLGELPTCVADGSSMFDALPRRGMGVQGRPRLDRGPVLGNGDSISDGPDAISSSTCTHTQIVWKHILQQCQKQ